MKIAYYPGCTLKLKAKNLEDSALAALGLLGVEVIELPRWNCCGGIFSLAADDLIHQVAPIRDLVRVRQEGCDTVMTLCSQCYNTLARANELVRTNAEARKTLNLFMTEEPDYDGGVRVVHYLELLHDQVGWDRLAAAVKKPLTGLKVAPFYGCALIRPREVAISPSTHPTLMSEFLAALGATPVDYPDSISCCGSFQAVADPDAALTSAANVLRSAGTHGAKALALSCPLCEYNLGARQEEICSKHPGIAGVPVYYFSQLLAIALGLGEEPCRFELNHFGAGCSNALIGC